MRARPASHERSGRRPAMSWCWRCSPRAARRCRRTMRHRGRRDGSAARSPGTRDRGERYCWRGPRTRCPRQEVAPPEYSGRGRHAKNPFTRVDVWSDRLAEADWTRIDARDGEKEPLVVEAVERRVRARTETGGEGPDELLLITRELQADHTYKSDYYLSCAAAATPLAEPNRIAKAEHRIEECLERAKGEAGLADYQVRNWPGWHRHQTLALLAAWFLTEETRRGENPDLGVDVAAAQAADRWAHRVLAGCQRTEQAMPPQYPLAASQRAGEVLLPSFTQHHAAVEERTEIVAMNGRPFGAGLRPRRPARSGDFRMMNAAGARFAVPAGSGASGVGSGGPVGHGRQSCDRSDGRSDPVFSGERHPRLVGTPRHFPLAFCPPRGNAVSCLSAGELRREATGSAGVVMVSSEGGGETLTGLSETEVADRLRRYGYNELPSSQGRSVLATAWEVVREPMFLLLLACGAIYLFLGDVQEALMLLGFVFVVLGITLYQERKTERALERFAISPAPVPSSSGVASGGGSRAARSSPATFSYCPKATGFPPMSSSSRPATCPPTSRS